ncbi:unnamed protein product [Adineta ricciae]|uniref:Uncharacterized protein n=1 Tax=Adineta ricciae TaxID=249248 RepID=A0A813VDY9_ADIRI|nr:unnamed protein product [Adineta ricciae]CAF0840378.1 unnamed protein product [Adineta ricciae]
MWSNNYHPYGNIQQQDMQPNNWLNQSVANGLNNPFGIRFDNYMNAPTTNPFAGQTFPNTYQQFGGFGYPFQR